MMFLLVILGFLAGSYLTDLAFHVYDQVAANSVRRDLGLATKPVRLTK